MFQSVIAATIRFNPLAPMALVLERAIADFAESLETDSPSHSVVCLALVEAGGHTASKCGISEPLQHKQGTLDSANLAESDGQTVLTTIGARIARVADHPINREDGADEARLRTVVEEHLQRFGFREELVFEWNSTGLTLGEGASNSNENPACVAVLRVEILCLQQFVAELLLKNQRLRYALENSETVLTDRSVEASPQSAIPSSLWPSAPGVIQEKKNQRSGSREMKQDMCCVRHKSIALRQEGVCIAEHDPVAGCPLRFCSKKVGHPTREAAQLKVGRN